jgi:hypothetical protein
MSLQCRLVDIKEVRAKGETVKPGDMWYYGKTLVIKLPCGDDWAPVHPDGAGWDITGEPPIITVRWVDEELIEGVCATCRSRKQRIDGQYSNLRRL